MAITIVDWKYFTDNKDILSKLWIKNPDYVSALKRWAYVWYLKKEIPLYVPYKNGGFIPQGFLAYTNFDVLSERSEWWASSFRDNAVVEYPPLNGELRQHQVDIVDKMLKHRYGFWHISTWVGKTWIILEITRRLKRKTLIVVDGATALTQFNKNIKEIFWIDAHVNGKKKHSDSPITITTIHSLSKLDPNSYGVILYDEADKYLGALNRRNLLSQIRTEFAYAVTGTTKLNEIEDKVFPMFYGRKEELLLKMMTPKYTQVRSSFEFWDFETFTDIVTAMYDNKDRNELIVNTTISRLKEKRANKVIVFSQRVEHAESLCEAFTKLWYKTFLLIGKVSRDEREQIRQEIISYQWQCILIGSVQIVGRWFDCPPLDLGVLTTAETFSTNLEQYLWRCIRPYEWKLSCEFIDIVDPRQPMLNSQAKKRIATFKKAFNIQ